MIYNKEELIQFEEEIAQIYQTGAIKGPIHLRDGNEDILIDIFKGIRPQDYVFATWANHLEALLKGVPKNLVKQRILDGRSMAMNFPNFRFYTSAIVGGILPIATGLAWSIKKQKLDEKVFVFIGDMTLHTGIAHESIKYSIYNRLPINFIVANNKKSVDTPTKDAWAPDCMQKWDDTEINSSRDRITYQLANDYNKFNRKYNRGDIIRFYSYKSKWPHSGVGQFIAF